MKRMHLDGLIAEGILTEEPAHADPAAQFAGMPGGGPEVRQVQGGADVIDMAGMVAQFEQMRRPASA